MSISHHRRFVPIFWKYSGRKPPKSCTFSFVELAMKKAKKPSAVYIFCKQQTVPAQGLFPKGRSVILSMSHWCRRHARCDGSA